MLTFFVLLVSVAARYEHEVSGARIDTAPMGLESEYIQTQQEAFNHSDLELLGINIPDSYLIKQLEVKMALGIKVPIHNMIIYGLKKVRIPYVHAQIVPMRVEAELIIDELKAQGDLVEYFFTKSIAINVKGLKARVSLTFVVNDGKLRVEDIDADLSCIEIQYNSMDYITPYAIRYFVNRDKVLNMFKNCIIDEVKAQINKRTENITIFSKFPNSMSPFNDAVTDFMEKLRRKYDPLINENHVYVVADLFTVSLTNTMITGLSSLAQVGDINIRMEDKTVVADLTIGTNKLEASTEWKFTAFSNLILRNGTASFTVEYIRAGIILAQILHVNEKPQVRDIKLDIGYTGVRCERLGPLDYVVEHALNTIPTKKLKREIINTIEILIMDILQEQLNQFGIREAIEIVTTKLTAGQL